MHNLEALLEYLSPHSPTERDAMEKALTKMVKLPRIIEFIHPSGSVTRIANPLHVIEYLARNTFYTNRGEVRDRFIIGFLFWTGVRVKELLLTRRENLDMKARRYIVPTIRRRLVHVGVELKHVPVPEMLFWSRYLARQSGERLVGIMSRQIERIVVKHLGRRYTPRSLRHSLGLWLASICGSLHEIMRLTGENYALMYYSLAYMLGITSQINNVRYRD